MSETQYAKGTTAEDLRIFLAFWPQLFVDVEEARQGMVENKEKILGDNTKPLTSSYRAKPLKNCPA
jgi:hypothetical protein